MTGRDSRPVADNQTAAVDPHDCGFSSDALRISAVDISLKGKRADGFVSEGFHRLRNSFIAIISTKGQYGSGPPARHIVPSRVLMVRRKPDRTKKLTFPLSRESGLFVRPVSV